jgi:hypothetical protein
MKPMRVMRCVVLSLVAVLIAGVSTAAAAPSPADTLFAGGDFAAARIAYVQEVARTPNDIQAILGLARVDLYENQLDAAAESANRVLALDSGSGPAKRILETVAQRRAVLASTIGIELPPAGVTIPFLESEPLPLIQFRIDGHTANLFLDTGAPDVVLDPDFARELGLAIVGGREGVFGGGRTAQVREATVHRIELGPIVLHDLKVGILPTRGMRLYKNRVADGVVGIVFLSRFLSTIDYANHRLLFQPRLTDTSITDGSAVVPMWLVGDHFARLACSVRQGQATA